MMEDRPVPVVNLLPAALGIWAPGEDALLHSKSGDAYSAFTAVLGFLFLFLIWEQHHIKLKQSSSPGHWGYS